MKISETEDWQPIICLENTNGKYHIHHIHSTKSLCAARAQKMDRSTWYYLLSCHTGRFPLQNELCEHCWTLGDRIKLEVARKE
jgi:hypothetical protein